MSRRRIEPPLGIPDRPNNVTCVSREAQIRDEFLRRLDYVFASYRLALQIDPFNSSLERLKRAVCQGRRTTACGSRLHPLLEIVVNHQAWRFARERTGGGNATLTQADVEKAVAWVATKIRAERGRPRAQLLDHHVAGLMALIQQTCGEAVTASRHKGTGEYQPKLQGPARILLLLREVDPEITETQLVHKVLQARRKYAGKAMRFRDFYPLYGASLGDTGTPILAPPYALERFEPSIPIYCP